MRLPQQKLGKKTQRGAVLLIMLVIVVMGGLTLFVNSLGSNATNFQLAHNRTTAEALAQARVALIGHTASQSITSISTGKLRLPDLGYSDASLSVPAEGSSPPNFSGNTQGYSLIGKFPWKSLGTPPLRDGYGECLWYALSGWFKNTNLTSSINWDTQGQIDVLDSNGNTIASNLVALVVAPGPVLAGQDRSLGDANYTQCGGNYNARNYMDTYDIANAISGALNYFSGSTNNRIAADTNNKSFIKADSDYYNDRFLFITVDDIFRPIIRRSDFATQVSALLNDSDLQSNAMAISVSGTKGTDNLDCSAITDTNNKAFCSAWKEMLLLYELPSPSPITIDASPTSSCTRVLVFSGQKTSSQSRKNSTDKADSANYLEGINLTSFTSSGTTFSGNSSFSAIDPSADLLRCLL